MNANERFITLKNPITADKYYAGFAALYTHKGSQVIIMCPNQEILEDVLVGGISPRAFDPAKFINAVIAPRP